MRVGAVIIIQESAGFLDVTNYVSLLGHHHDDQFGRVAPMSEHEGGQIGKIRAVAAFALQKRLRILQWGQFKREISHDARQSLGRDALLLEQIIQAARTGCRCRAD